MQKIPSLYINGLKAAYYATSTAISGTSSFTIPAGYIASDLLVFEDGVLQRAGTDYTVSGTTLSGTFATGAQITIVNTGGSQGIQGPAGNMTGSNNLSEITNPALARTNLQITYASAAEYRAATANRILTADGVYLGAAVVTLTDATTVTPDLSTFINASLTLGGNRTMANPINMKVGQTGFITLQQDGTGSRTISWGNQYFFSGGTAPTLSTAAGAIDRLYYTVTSSTSIDCSIALNMAKTYDPDAAAYFAAHTVQASSSRKDLINNLITGLKSDGVWALLDNFWLLSSHTDQSSLVNAVRPSKSLLKYGSPYFTTDLGWQSVASAGSNSGGNCLYTPDPYWGSGFKRSSVTNGSFGVWTNTTYTDANYICGQTDNNFYEYMQFGSSSNFLGKFAGGTAISGTPGSTSKGMRAVVKNNTSSNASLAYNDIIAGSAAAGTTLTSSSTFSILSAGGLGSYAGTNNRISFAYTGNELTVSQYFALYTRINTYLTAIGAN